MTRDTEEEVKPCKFVSGACVNCDATERGDCQGFVCNTYAPREWQGLTDEQLDDIAVVARRGNLHDLRITIEAKLKENNT